MDKAFKTSLSLPQSMRDEAQTRANHSHRGNISAYIQRLIAADLAASPAPTSFDDAILSKLATTYAGYFAPRLAHALELAQVDQPKALHGLLSALCEHLARGCSVDDLVICPRSEWQPEPAQFAAAEAPAVYAAGQPPTSKTAGMTKAQFKAQGTPSSASSVHQIAQDEAQRRQAEAHTPGATPQKPHP